MAKTEKVTLRKEEMAKNNDVTHMRNFHKLSDIREEIKVAFNRTHKTKSKYQFNSDGAIYERFVFILKYKQKMI